MTKNRLQSGASQSRPQSFASKIGWSAAAGICDLFGRLTSQIMIARMLGTDGVGRIAYIIWLIEISSAFFRFGLPGSLTRYLAELHGQKKAEQATRFAQWVFARYLALVLLGSVVVGVLFFRSAQYAGAESVLPVLIMLFLVRSLQFINQANLAGQQRFDLLARISVAATVALVASVAVGAYFFGVTGALYGYIGGTAFPALYSFTILRGFSPRQKVVKGMRRRMWKFTFYLWLNMLIIAFVWSRMEIYFLERYWNVHEIAIFTVAITFALLVHQVAHAFSGAFMSHFAELDADGNHELVQQHFESTTRLMAFGVFPLAAGGAAVMPVLLPLLYGTAFTPAVPHAMVVMASSVLAVYLKVSPSLVYAKERPHFLVIVGGVGAILSIAAGFLIVSRFGAWGAVWTRMFSQSSVVALGIWYITRRLKCSYPCSALGRNFMSAACCGLSAWSIVRLVPVGIIGLCVAIPVGVAVYAVSTRVFHVLGPEECGQLRRIANRLPRNIRKPCMLLLNIVATPRVA